VSARRDQSYLARMPADTKVLIEELKLELPEPVLTVGRVEEPRPETEMSGEPAGQSSQGPPERTTDSDTPD
jgi:hypothetical protein